MSFVKKMSMGILVLMISGVIFFILVKEQDVKKNILRTTLQLFGNEVLAMVPDGPQKEAITEKINAFIDSAERNELPEEQIERTVAMGLNMSMHEEPPSPEQLEAVFAIHLDSLAENEKMLTYRQYEEIDQQRLAHEINTIITFRRQLDALEKAASESIKVAIADQVVFAADSGLKVLIPKDMQERHRENLPDEWHRKIKMLDQEKMIRTYNREKMPPLPPMEVILRENLQDKLSPEEYAHLILQLREIGRLSRHFSPPDMPEFFTNPDSVRVFIKRFTMAAPDSLQPRENQQEQW